MEKIQDLAIVLRWVPYEERHRVVTAITENHGKISALARNSIQSRRFGGSLEPFSASLWTFVERNGADLYRLEEAEIRRGFEGLRKNFEHLALASAFSEILLRVAPEREPCPDLFKLHSNALAVIEEYENLELIPLLNGYLAKILQWGGNQPQLQKCLSCAKPLDEFAPQIMLNCHVSDAAWVCPDCRHLKSDREQGFDHRFLRVSALAIWDFYVGLTIPLKQIPSSILASREEHRALFIFLESLFVFHVPGFDKAELKSLKFLGLDSIHAKSFP